MNRIFFLFAFVLIITSTASAQYEGYTQEGEVGITAGIATYFGDLNNRADPTRLKPALGIFFRKQFGNYIGVRLTGNYARLGFSDQHSNSDFQKQRNLSFNTDIFEVALRGDFNFFRYDPMDPQYQFTPYVSLGVGVFSYDPYAYLGGEKYFLRPLGTEGQNVGFNGKKPYGSTAISIPFGVGVKYALNQKLNLSFEITHRFTTTDYLDDVSSQYAGIANFTPNSPASLLQDRSYEIDPNKPLGVQGFQRGWEKQKDQFIIAEVGLSFNITSYRCPTAN